MDHVAVFGTNILLSALLSLRGNPFRCLALARVGRIESVTCLEILFEFREKLEAKFSFLHEDAHSAANEVARVSRLVHIPNSLRVIADDPADDKVVECAVVGDATHIVSGDKKHLFKLRNYGGIHIVSPAEFIQLVSADM